MKVYQFLGTIILLIGLFCLSGCVFTGQDKEQTAGAKSGAGRSADPDEKESSRLSDEIEPETPETVEETAEPASGGKKTTVVKFGRGKTSGTYRNAVVRGESHSYLLGAAQGQVMNIEISSTEDNAVFRVRTPGGKYLGNTSEAEGTENFNETLPASGNYRITVSPTRGNATYKITFTVTGARADKPADPPPATGGRTTVVKFRKGGTSAGYSNSVIRGERDTYILGARGGQQMSVSISSLEDNAVFAIRAPNGRTLVTESRGWTGRLPADGNYRITVGGTRGNASYKINFSVR